jgi:hypothetical protein
MSSWKIRPKKLPTGQDVGSAANMGAKANVLN